MTHHSSGRPRAFRRSPCSFGAKPAETELRDGWTVVLRYEGEDGDPGAGPRLVDLSHRRRWDFQDSGVADLRPMGLPVPEGFGEVGVHDGLVINRMNRTQVAIWHLGAPPPPDTPADTGFTEVTDGHCMLAFVGDGVPEVLEHLTALDLFDPARDMPFLTQGPVLHVPCQVVTFAPDLVVMTLARGYGETFAEAVLGSGGIAGLRPGGERAFTRAFDRAFSG
ncbi:MAG: sarcosine oxidase subunit gamma SoxG [Gemmatimonadetes bacterium]|nr:sarcosine oxidase subunit gamma SoxG [Gemmatimonadota bacterium]